MFFSNGFCTNWRLHLPDFRNIFVIWHECLDVALTHIQYDQEIKDIYFKVDFPLFVDSEIEWLILFLNEWPS